MLICNIEKYKQSENEQLDITFSHKIDEFIYENHVNEKESKKPIHLNFNKMLNFFPIEFNIIENFEINFDYINKLFEQTVQIWCGKKRKLFYDVPNKFFNLQNYFNLTSDYCDKLIKIQASVDVIQEYQDLLSTVEFYCSSCGITYNSNRTKSKLCKKCFKKSIIIKSKKFISRRFFELSDPKEIEGNSSINAFIDIYQKEDRDLIPKNLVGQDLEIIGVLRLFNAHKSSNFTRVFEIVGFRIMKNQYIEYKDQKKIIEKIKGTENAFVKIAMSMNKNVKGMDYLKMILFSCCVGLNYPDEQFGQTHIGQNIMVIGNPAISKSKVMENLTRYFFKAKKTTGLSMTKAGANGTVQIINERRVVSAGELSRCDKGVLFIDECKHMHDEVKHALLTAMSDGWHTIKYAGTNKTFKYNTNIVLIGNPKGKDLDPNIPLKDQVEFDPEFLSRCFITLMATPYYLNEQNLIMKDKLKEIMEITRINNDDNVMGKDNGFLNEQDLIFYANIVKTFPNPELKKSEEKMIEEYILGIADNDISEQTFNSGNYNRKLDLRMITGFKIFCKIIARAEFSIIVKKEHIDLAINIYENTMMKFRQVFNMDSIDSIEETLIDKNKKIYPKSQIEKKKFILNNIFLEKEIDFGDLLIMCVEHAISEKELNEYLTKLKSDGEIFEIRPSFFKRAL